MERTTLTTKKMVVILYDFDDKETDRFHLHNEGGYAFADMANTLDHARQTGLQPFAAEPKAAVAGKK